MINRALSFFFLLFTAAAYGADDISGFWKTINEDGVAQCIIAVYEYDDVYYGRIIGSYDETGKMVDTIYKPVKRAPGVIGDPFYSGLDIIWGLVDSGVKFKGKILDPEKGNVYNSELWIDRDGNLVVRGKLLMFGRSQTWLPAEESDFPKDFKKPDLATLVPNVPEVK
jgi:uncharacterized protein (DUF2147 family)